MKRGEKKEEEEEKNNNNNNNNVNEIYSSTDLNKNFFDSKFKIFILTCQKKKISLIMNFRFRMTVMFCSRFAIPDFFLVLSVIFKIFLSSTSEHLRS